MSFEYSLSFPESTNEGLARSSLQPHFPPALQSPDLQCLCSVLWWLLESVVVRRVRQIVGYSSVYCSLRRTWIFPSVQGFWAGSTTRSWIQFDFRKTKVNALFIGFYRFFLFFFSNSEWQWHGQWGIYRSPNSVETAKVVGRYLLLFREAVSEMPGFGPGIFHNTAVSLPWGSPGKIKIKNCSVSPSHQLIMRSHKRRLKCSCGNLFQNIIGESDIDICLVLKFEVFILKNLGFHPEKDSHRRLVD